MTVVLAQVAEIYRAAIPVLRIHAIGGAQWTRNVAKGSRIGPWLQAKYSVMDHAAWDTKAPCLYLVAGSDNLIRYVGISRNRMRDRWRTSPAYDAQTKARLPENQLFHSQCWKHIERESAEGTHEFHVRCITGKNLLPVLARIGPPMSAFPASGADPETTVNAVERWLCNNKSAQLVSWNTAMTR